MKVFTFKFDDTGEELLFTNLKKTYLYYAEIDPKDHVSYSTLASKLKSIGYFQSNGLTISFKTVQ